MKFDGLRTVPTNSKVFLGGLLNMWEKQVLTSAIEIQKENWAYNTGIRIQGYLCAVQNYAEKAELSKCSWYPKRKLGVTMHFSKIINQQYL